MSREKEIVLICLVVVAMIAMILIDIQVQTINDAEKAAEEAWNKLNGS